VTTRVGIDRRGGATRSVVRTRSRGVTVLPSAEGPSPRSDPRWTRRRAQRSARLLAGMVARRRRSADDGGATAVTKVPPATC
jgi:hypothetical protein